MEIADKPFPGASKPQALARVDQPPVYENSFNVSLTLNKAMTIVNETIEQFVQSGKVHAVGFGVFQVNDRELAELNDAIGRALSKFTLTL